VRGKVRATFAPHIIMNVVFSYIGKIPQYAVDCIFQLRLFYNGDIYIITDDVYSSVLRHPALKNIYIVPYNDVRHEQWENLMKTHERHLAVIPGLKERQFLVKTSMERFFLISNLMRKYELTDVFFMEFDNMMYFDPREMLVRFSNSSDMAYTIDDADRGCAVFMYVKTVASFDPLLNYTIKYVIENTGREWLNEMQLLYRYWRNAAPRGSVQILPTLFKAVDFAPASEVPVAENYKKYNSIFDSQALGIYMCGVDKYHTGGGLEVGKRSKWSRMDFTKYSYIWLIDELGRKIPYILDDTGMPIKINNLHVHSKDLFLAASIPVPGVKVDV